MTQFEQRLPNLGYTVHPSELTVGSITRHMDYFGQVTFDGREIIVEYGMIGSLQ